MTLTEEKQPYGRVTRYERTIDDCTYVISLVGAGYMPQHERWELRLAATPGSRQSYCDLPIGSSMKVVVARLLG